MHSMAILTLTKLVTYDYKECDAGSVGVEYNADGAGNFRRLPTDAPDGAGEGGGLAQLRAVGQQKQGADYKGYEHLNEYVLITLIDDLLYFGLLWYLMNFIPQFSDQRGTPLLSEAQFIVVTEIWHKLNR